MLIMVVAAFMIGLSKGGFGGPVLVSLLTPLISLALPAGQAVGLVLPLLIFGDIFAVWIYWRKWDMRLIKMMLPPAILGIILGGIVLLTLANSNQNALLRHILGLFTLIFILYKIASERLKAIQYSPRDWHAYLAGGASGFGSALANVGSPPFTAYMLLQKVEPISFLGTTSLFFAILNALKLPITLSSSNVLDVHQFLSIAWVMLFVPVGVWFGKKFTLWVNPKTFENIMLAVLFGISLLMLFGT